MIEIRSWASMEASEWHRITRDPRNHATFVSMARRVHVLYDEGWYSGPVEEVRASCALFNRLLQEFQEHQGEWEQGQEEGVRLFVLKIMRVIQGGKDGNGDGDIS